MHIRWSQREIGSLAPFTFGRPLGGRPGTLRPEASAEQEREPRIGFFARHFEQLEADDIVRYERVVSHPVLQIRACGLVCYEHATGVRQEAANEQEDAFGHASREPFVVSSHKLAGSALFLRKPEKYDEHGCTFGGPGFRRSAGAAFVAAEPSAAAPPRAT
jgi:hypothetical protein